MDATIRPVVCSAMLHNMVQLPDTHMICLQGISILEHHEDHEDDSPVWPSNFGHQVSKSRNAYEDAPKFFISRGNRIREMRASSLT